MTSEILAFLREHRLAVEATVGAGGAPQAAVIGVVFDDDFSLFFDTVKSSRKYENLARDPRMAFVIGWDERTVQYEGVADEPAGEELARLQRLYFAGFPDGPSRLAWPGIVYVRVRPRWIRYSDFRTDPPRLVELSGAALAPLPGR